MLLSYLLVTILLHDMADFIQEDIPKRLSIRNRQKLQSTCQSVSYLQGPVRW